MASILDDEKFQNLQLGLARALRTMRTESAALRKRQDDTEFEREKLSAKSDFERERLAKQEESKRLGVAARLPGSAGVEAQARLVPGVDRERLAREDVGRTYIEDLLQHGQYESASDIAAPLGIRGFKPSAKEEAETDAARALELQRKEQTKNQAQQSQALTFLYGRRARETQKKIEKIDQGLSGSQSISQLNAASDIFLKEYNLISKQIESIKEQDDYLMSGGEPGLFIDDKGETTSDRSRAVVNPAYVKALDGLLKNRELLSGKIKGLSKITGQRISLPGEEEDDLQAQIDEDLELLGDADPVTIRNFLLKKYPDYLKEIPQQAQIGPQPPSPGAQQRAFGPQLPERRDQVVDATPEQRAAVQREFSEMMKKRPNYRTEADHRKYVLDFLSQKYMNRIQTPADSSQALLQSDINERINSEYRAAMDARSKAYNDALKKESEKVIQELGKKYNVEIK